MSVLEWPVYIDRFALEMVTVFGLIVGGLIVGNGSEKLIFPIFGVLVVLLWGSFVAPKAAFPQGIIIKFIVELFCFTIGTIGIYQLFGSQCGILFWVIAVVDLVLVYLLLLFQ